MQGTKQSIKSKTIINSCNDRNKKTLENDFREFLKFYLDLESNEIAKALCNCYPKYVINILLLEVCFNLRIAFSLI